MRRISCERGVSLVEPLVAMALLLVGLLALVGLVDGAVGTTGKTSRREAATALARQLVENVRSVPYADVQQGTLEAKLKARPGLADERPDTPASWEIERRRMVFTVTVSACKVDDPRDGAAGVHDGSFCPGTANGTGDDEPDDYRRAKITVTAPGGSAVGAVTQATAVTRGGRARTVDEAGNPAPPGIAPTSFKLTTCSTGCVPERLGSGYVAPSTTATYNTTGIGALGFTMTTAGPVAWVRWSLDGVEKGSATKSGSSWQFSWNGASGLTTTYPDQTPDGTYEVSAQAYDADGERVGARVSLTVTLNRFIPDAGAYTQPLAGRNPLYDNLPEVEWFPTNASGMRRDRDVVGFRIWKRVGGSTTYFIPAATNDFLPLFPTWYQDSCPSTSCPSARSITYELYPVDRSPSGNVRLGGNIRPSSRDVNQPNRRPNPPTALTLTKSGDATNLSWTPPTGTGDPDTADCAQSFRIYRTPVAASSPTFADRLDRTQYGVQVTGCSAGTSTSYTDYTYGASYKYWITSVDSQLAESVLVGPVGG